MHLKLEKFSNLCQSMNTESAQRVEDTQVFKDELEKVRAERDEMACEIEQLKTAMAVYEKERVEHRQVQEAVVNYENQGLQQAEEAIVKRDEMIDKLSARLETTLETLAIEREQQRQRRQIFFPPTSRNPYPPANGQSPGDNNRNDQSNDTLTGSSNPVGSNGGSEQEEELKRLREELLESQRKLESSQLQAKQRETALLFRCSYLEKQLDQATQESNSTCTEKPPDETHPLR